MSEALPPAGRRGGRGGRRGERAMVPPARFQSYYGRPVLKPPVWEPREIAGYLFTGGLAAGSSLLAAGADLTDRPQLRRSARLTALVALGLSGAALVSDLGRPARFHYMLRAAKRTSPMSVGTWILTGYALPAGLTAAAEVLATPLGAALPLPARLRGLVSAAGRPAGIAAAAFAPALGTYTAVLLGDTAVPTWHAAHPQLPVLFAGSAAAASAGTSLIFTPVAQAGPARRLAVGGAAADLAAATWMERSTGLAGETLRQGRGGTLLRAARVLTATGAALVTVAGRRHRVVAAAGGAALVAGSVCTRFGVFYAGVASTTDPKYVVVPQRERLAERARSAAADGSR